MAKVWSTSSGLISSSRWLTSCSNSSPSLSTTTVSTTTGDKKKRESLTKPELPSTTAITIVRPRDAHRQPEMLKLTVKTRTTTKTQTNSEEAYCYVKKVSATLNKILGRY